MDEIMGMHTLNLGITGPFVVPEWKHRNAIVFDGATPSLKSIIHIKEVVC